ncbi:hypothetical protein SPOG_02292 [Schizosaccharomyces cryophilus OY26]|uniref:Uncharacterized protein n=1 Tax=Schizosaccharomyces cryophilus (strain OY26 / ATCC MYA-4695 / CBS 11777 / NBRC 106824 / NRRL Y48691) TaxID=653667 RepID=S9VTA7_SCHCR|nr:uncharacterized protein SPOG_02292 [Schizosaccharomyces cryophilus OY26]EPY51113.1 hypothetical protein SPOG_02292 [Schizosaccharomyces cryophilus OY26]
MNIVEYFFIIEFMQLCSFFLCKDNKIKRLVKAFTSANDLDFIFLSADDMPIINRSYQGFVSVKNVGSTLAKDDFYPFHTYAFQSSIDTRIALREVKTRCTFVLHHR